MKETAIQQPKGATPSKKNSSGSKYSKKNVNEVCMSNYYGDIPCVKLNGIVHITKCATECLCGQKWSYSRPSNREDFKTENIIWRSLNAVTCEKCKELGVKKGK